MNERRDSRRRNMAHPVKQSRFTITSFETGLMVVAFCFALTFLVLLISKIVSGTL